MVIEKLDRSVEQVSRSRVVLAQRPKNLGEVQKTVKPLTDTERYMGFPAAEEVNNNNLTEAKGKRSTDTNKQEKDKQKESTHDANEKRR